MGPLPPRSQSDSLGGGRWAHLHGRAPFLPRAEIQQQKVCILLTYTRRFLKGKKVAEHREWKRGSHLHWLRYKMWDIYFPGKEIQLRQSSITSILAEIPLKCLEVRALGICRFRKILAFSTVLRHIVIHFNILSIYLKFLKRRT